MTDGARLTKDQWMVLIAAFLGWMFDGVEMGLFPIVARPALQDLMKATDDILIGPWNGYLAAVFLLGAAAGGIVFGWLGDRIGRVRSMTLSIVAYSVFTGACYFAMTPWQLGVLRFLASLGMGGEWALGVALVMECWPDRLRPILAGVIAAACNVGIVLIAVVGILFPITTATWRYMMLAGLAPGLLAIFVICFVPESERWKLSVKRAAAHPIREVFTPPLLKITLLAIVFCSVMMIGTWAAMTSFGPLWADRMTQGKYPYAKAVFQVAMASGAIVGCLIGPWLARVLGRRPAYFLVSLAALVACQFLFRAFKEFDALFVGMVFLAGIPVVAFYGLMSLYLPELYPTRVRATGQGLTYNFGRFLAAVGALSTGQLVGLFGGDYAKACATITLVFVVGMVVIWFAPETKGKPLPE
jgi:MFS family permease